MEKSTGEMRHYYDTGEHAYTRGLNEYLSMVFKDGSEQWLNSKPDYIHPENPQGWVSRHDHSIKRYYPDNNGNKVCCRKDNTIAYEWDLRGSEIFGGKEGFFSDNSTILDLGSGKALAVEQINQLYASRNVKCLGVDYRYVKDQPQRSGEVVAGLFDNLPFADNAFNRILSVESFPSWLPSDERTIGRYIEEITRICKPAAIWRGTMPTYDLPDEKIFPADIIISRIVENGWEFVLIHNWSFAAKLQAKKNN